MLPIEKALQSRSNNTCELCASTHLLKVYEVPPYSQAKEEDCLLICDKCLAQLDKKEALDTQHWSCLNESMWSEIPAVQVVSWRLLNRLRDETWAVDALDMLYLTDEQLTWAKATHDHEISNEVTFHKDCNGTILQAGDTVILTKMLDVKGSTLTAKMGTVVKHIRLVADNDEQIEGKIDGQMIVILTKFVKKVS